MQQFESLQDILEHELKDLYSAETQLVEALPKLAGKCTSEDLKQAFNDHLGETKAQVERLEMIGKRLGLDISGENCEAMQGLVHEGEEILEKAGDPVLLDALIIGAARRVEHYEIAGYESALALAESLGLSEVVDLLAHSLEQEQESSETLAGILDDQILSFYGSSEDLEEDELADDDYDRPRRS